MRTRSDFAKGLADKKLSHVDRAVALLWYYRNSQEFDERSASALATDLQDEGFPRPNVTRLATDLKLCRDTIRGKRPDTFQIDVRRVPALDERYLPLLGARKVAVTGAILSPDSLVGTRGYLEQLAYQINGSYDAGFYDGCAVLCRRLMETLIIEIYLHAGRHHDIQANGVFLPLERLLGYIKGDAWVPLGRTAPKTMNEVKQLGDTAAHDRTYVTKQLDIDDIKARYRKLVGELLMLAGLAR